MADDEMSFGLQHGKQTIHDLPLRFRIEIDHDVAQKNHVEGSDLRQRRIQVDRQKPDAASELRIDQEGPRLAPNPFQTIGLEIGLRDFSARSILYWPACAAARTRELMSEATMSQGVVPKLSASTIASV